MFRRLYERLVKGANPEFVLMIDDARLPTHGSDNAAGFDLYATRRHVLEPGIVTVLPLGICSQFRPGWVAHVWDRSGMGAKGVKVCGGVIDADYRGQWFVVLVNCTATPVEVEKGDRVAQVVFVPCYTGSVRQVATLRDTARGVGAFGSTGR